jgi:hypothetical protein
MITYYFLLFITGVFQAILLIIPKGPDLPFITSFFNLLFTFLSPVFYFINYDAFLHFLIFLSVIIPVFIIYRVVKFILRID